MPLRNLIRWAALVCAIAIVLWLAPEVVRNYRDWRESAVNDPSAAGLGLGLLIFIGLKRNNELPRGTRGGSTQT